MIDAIDLLFAKIAQQKLVQLLRLLQTFSKRLFDDHTLPRGRVGAGAADDELLRAQTLHDRHERIRRSRHVEQTIAGRAVLLVAILELRLELIEAGPVTVS